MDYSACLNYYDESSSKDFFFILLIHMHTNICLQSKQRQTLLGLTGKKELKLLKRVKHLLNEIFFPYPI